MKFVEGQIIKNAKELGYILGKEVKEKVQTKTKNSWFKELDTYCTWHKEGQKIIIDEVFTEQKEKVDGRKNNGGARARISKYSHVPTTKGVYYIVDNDRDIYVGSTSVSFRERYQQHTQKDNHCESKVIISKEHTFGVLYDMSDIEDVELIRMIEDEYINYFSNNTEYNLVNKRGNKIKTIRQLKFKNKKPIKLTKKIIKLTNEEDYLKAIEILLENGISIENKLV